MEVFAQRQKAQEKEECQIMDEISDQMCILQCRQRRPAEHMAEQPGKTQRSRELSMNTLLGLGGHQAGFKHAFRNYQCRYQTENKDGFSGMVFPVSGWHGIACGFNNSSADGGDRTGN